MRAAVAPDRVRGKGEIMRLRRMGSGQWRNVAASDENSKLRKENNSCIWRGHLGAGCMQLILFPFIERVFLTGTHQCDKILLYRTHVPVWKDDEDMSRDLETVS